MAWYTKPIGAIKSINMRSVRNALGTALGDADLVAIRSRALKGAAWGAGIGAAAGGIQGAVSERESVLGGAFKGALAGGVIGAGVGAGKDMYRQEILRRARATRNTIYPTHLVTEQMGNKGKLLTTGGSVDMAAKNSNVINQGLFY
jgi:hypothetical protein